MKKSFFLWLIFILTILSACGSSNSGSQSTGINVKSIDGETIEPNTTFSYVADSAISDSATISNFFITPTASSCISGNRLPATIEISGSSTTITLDDETVDGSFQACIDELPLEDGSSETETYSFTVEGGEDPSFLGILDTVFGNGNGYVSLSTPESSYDGFDGASIGSDSSGNIYFFFYLYQDPEDPEGDETGYTYIWKVNSEGETVTSFGTNGLLSLDDSGYETENVEVLADGSLLLLGRPEEKMTIWKFDSNGDLDTTFGTSGKVTYTGTDNSSALMVIVHDEKIYITGRARNEGELNQMAIWRYSSSGDLDTTFGTNGVTLYAVDENHADGQAIEILESERILVAGTISQPSEDEHYLVLWEYNSNGTELISTFGTDSGVNITDIILEPAGMTVDSEGNIYVSGDYEESDEVMYSKLVKFDSDGLEDESFERYAETPSAPATGLSLIYNNVFFSTTDEENESSKLFGLNTTTGELDTSLFTDGYYSFANYYTGTEATDSVNRIMLGLVKTDSSEVRIYRFR